MRFLFGNAKLWQRFQDQVSLYLQFPRQLVDANLFHT